MYTANTIHIAGYMGVKLTQLINVVMYLICIINLFTIYTVQIYAYI